LTILALCLRIADKLKSDLSNCAGAYLV